MGMSCGVFPSGNTGILPLRCAQRQNDGERIQQMPPKVSAVIFDAGNTLVFPRIDLIAPILRRLGYNATVDDFYHAERIGKRKLDEWLWPLLRNGNTPRRADYYYWTEYLRALVERVRVPKEKQQEVGLQLAEGFKEIHIWSHVFPETPAYLETLRRRGYLLGIVSNSLGLIESQLRRVDLARYFEFIIDSHFVGVEKPHPEIFRLALSRCGCEPAEAVFVGDLYSTDVGGAQNAGFHGVLMDWVGAYPEAESPRITSLPELDSILTSLENKARS
jgi:HAD superfamily hydrolase (TIGR01662 family)